MFTTGLLEIHELAAILERVTYKDWQLQVYLGRHEGPHLAIRANVLDAFPPKDDPFRKVPLDIHLRVPRVARRDEEHFLDFVLERLQIAENHETREFFKVDRRVYDSPHKKDADRDV